MTAQGRFGVVVVLLLGLARPACAGLAPGATLDATTADEAKDLLPPEIYRHFKNGEYANPVVDFPNSRWQWDDGFDEASRRNAEHLTLDEHKSPIDRTTGKRPAYITGLPFPNLSEDDPDAGYKALWNLDYAYYTGGNSYNWTTVFWIGRREVERSALQEVRFLYYDGQPRQYSPPTNPSDLLFQFLAVTVNPADLQGTAALGYRFKDPTKRDLSWAYVPALRRVRAVSPANRSDGFLGSDLSQDDGFFFDGKPEDFVWKLVGHSEGLRFVDPGSIAGETVHRPLPGGGWRTPHPNDRRAAGFLVKGWPGVAWAPTASAVARRKFWVLEGVPKDKYYLYGRIELWIDDVTWQGAWNRKFSWRGELLNVYQISGFATAPFNDRERWWGATFAYQMTENVKQERATASGLGGPGEDPPDDRRIPLDPQMFDYQTLSRFGK